MPIDDTAPPPTSPRPRRSRAKAVAAPAAAESPPGRSVAPEVEDDGATIEADRVDVRMGAVGRVESTELSVHQGAVGAARADRIVVERGAIGGAVAREVQLSQGVARGVLAQHVRIEQSFVRSVVAADVTTGGPTGIGILIARRVVGDVKVLLDWRGALAFGAAAGLVAGLVRRIGRGRAGRS
jgi:hypothetical protein